MKEIWKLLELLNEYSKNIWYFNEEDLQWQTKAWILSKEFWWVKWLVENDKINREKKEIEESDYDITFTWALTMDKKSDLDIMVDTLLMLISISDTPIEDLISYLK